MAGGGNSSSSECLVTKGFQSGRREQWMRIRGYGCGGGGEGGQSGSLVLGYGGLCS